MATFAYDNANQFDLVALPGRRAAELAQARDTSSVIINPEEPAPMNDSKPSGAAPETHRPHLLKRILRSMPSVAAVSFRYWRMSPPAAIDLAPGHGRNE